MSLVTSGLAESGWFRLRPQLLRELVRMLNTILLGMGFLGWSLHLFVQDERQYNDLGILHLRITEIPLNTMSMQMSWKLSLKSGIGMVWVKSLQNILKPHNKGDYANKT